MIKGRAGLLIFIRKGIKLMNIIGASFPTLKRRGGLKARLESVGL
jgi:hypothetical protein